MSAAKNKDVKLYDLGQLGWGYALARVKAGDPRELVRWLKESDARPTTEVLKFLAELVDGKVRIRKKRQSKLAPLGDRIRQHHQYLSRLTNAEKLNFSEEIQTDLKTKGGVDELVGEMFMCSADSVRDALSYRNQFRRKSKQSP